MRRNSLDPSAWLDEPHRFDMPGETADIRLGVHTTTSFDTALAYAVHKASQQGDLEDGEPNCGIIFQLDMTGLEALPEADSLVSAEDGDVVVHELFGDSTVVKAFNSKSASVLAEAVLHFIDSSRDGWESNIEESDFWFEMFWQTHVFENGPTVILSALEALAEEDKEALYRALDRAQYEGNFPLELWAAALGQFRYMSPIGFDRVLAVYAVHPVNPVLVYEGDEDEDYEENEEGPMTFDPTYPDAPDTVRLWASGRTISSPEYHGTDIVRARAAFPELAKTLVSPWDFGQPKGVGPA